MGKFTIIHDSWLSGTHCPVKITICVECLEKRTDKNTLQLKPNDVSCKCEYCGR